MSSNGSCQKNMNILFFLTVLWLYVHGVTMVLQLVMNMARLVSIFSWVHPPSVRSTPLFPSLPSVPLPRVRPSVLLLGRSPSLGPPPCSPSLSLPPPPPPCSPSLGLSRPSVPLPWVCPAPSVPLPWVCPLRTSSY